MKINIFDHTGKTTNTLEVKPAEFGSKPNETLLAQAIRVYTSNAHQRTSKVKTRGEVIGSRRKIWRQKGTGRARHGNRYAPIFVGGGVAHGPKGVRAQNLKLTKKMKRKALASSLLIKMQSQDMAILSDCDKLKPKTSVIANLLSKISNHPKTKVLVVLDKKYPNIYAGMRNIQKTDIRRANLVNAYDIVSFDKIILSKEALNILKDRIKIAK